MSFFNPAKSVKKWTLGGLQLSGDLTNQSIQSFDPYRKGGENAYNMTLGALGLGGQRGYNEALSTFRTSPGYDWQLQQGLGAIENSAAARGGLQSGATLKALQGYGQGLADQEWDQWVSRLGGLSSMGMQAAGQQAQLREGQANRIYGGYSGIGNAQASQNLGFQNMALNGLFGLGKMFLGGF